MYSLVADHQLNNNNNNRNVIDGLTWSVTPCAQGVMIKFGKQGAETYMPYRFIINLKTKTIIEAHCKP